MSFGFLKRLFRKGESPLTPEEEAGAVSMVAKLVNCMLVDALRRGASEISLERGKPEPRESQGELEEVNRVIAELGGTEPGAEGLLVRYRIAGEFQTVLILPPSLEAEVIRCVKVLAKLDPSATRQPQEGRLRMTWRQEYTKREAEFHVSVVPTPQGEKISLHVLKNDSLAAA